MIGFIFGILIGFGLGFLATVYIIATVRVIDEIENEENDLEC